jgi:hypothetical protein
MMVACKVKTAGSATLARSPEGLHPPVTLLPQHNQRIGLSGIGRCMQRHRHQEFIRFLNAVDESRRASPSHAILDNYATHKHPKVLACTSRQISRSERIATTYSTISIRIISSGSIDGRPIDE